MKRFKISVAGTRMPAVVALAVTALAVAACGGSNSGSGSTPAPQNAAPVVSGLTTQTINQDTPTAAIPFTVSDDGGVGALVLSATSSDPSIVLLDGITLAGTGANRTLMVTPVEDATGMVNVQVQARDAQGQTGTSTLALTVAAVTQSFTSYTNSTFALDGAQPPAQVSGFTFTQDADAETTFDPLLQ